MADWKRTAFTSGVDFSSIGNGLAFAFGTLVASVSSGLTFDGSGNIIVKNGSGIAIDGSGHVTVNQGVGLAIDGSGFLVVNPGTGLSTGAGTVFIPGGAITSSLLAALAVATANIQAGAVTSAKIASATITTANIGAAQITTALIANGAITNALIGSAAIGTANIQNAAITTALIATAAIGNAQISSLDASKITTGTLNAINITAGTLTLNLNGITTNVSNSLTGSNFVGLAVSTNGASTATRVMSGEIDMLGPGGNFTVKVGSAGSNFGVIDITNSGTTWCSLDGSFGTNGRINLLGGAEFHVGAVTVIDGSRNATFVGLRVSAVPRFDTVSTAAVSTPTWAGASCPSGYSGAPQTWMEVNANGFLGWVPVF